MTFHQSQSSWVCIMYFGLRRLPQNMEFQNEWQCSVFDSTWNNEMDQMKRANFPSCDRICALETVTMYRAQWHVFLTLLCQGVENLHVHVTNEVPVTVQSIRGQVLRWQQSMAGWHIPYSSVVVTCLWLIPRRFYIGQRPIVHSHQLVTNRLSTGSDWIQPITSIHHDG